VISSLMKAIVGARTFQVALSKRSPLERVIGPVNLPHYRETGDILHKRDFYLTRVDIAMIDEIGKMADTVGHDILGAANERWEYEVRDEQSVHDIPLSTLYTASNEILGAQSDDAAALWDRLLFRVVVDSIQDRSNFVRLFTLGEPNFTVTVDWADVYDVIHNVVPAIKMSPAALDSLVDLRYNRFPDAGIVVSDRRWLQAGIALRASAFLAGRDEVTPADMATLRFTHWETVETRKTVERIVMGASSAFGDRLFETRDVLDSINARLAELEPLDRENIDRNAYPPDARAKLGDVRDNLDMMLLEAGGEPIPMFKSVSDYHRDTYYRLWTGLLNMAEGTLQTPTVQLGQGDGGNI
jgi:MoxR-like ATPase